MPPAIPIATYRLQLTADFDFDAAASVVPYLKALGITHLYASPFMKARKGSSHGYDVVDHTKINPELGGEAGFKRLSAALGQRHDRQAPIRVLPFQFTASSKSELGWDLLGLIESGRLKEYAETAAPGSAAALLTTTFHEQLKGITYDTVPGPGRQLRWGAPPGRHDDLVLSLALVSALDGFDWRERIARGAGS